MTKYYAGIGSTQTPADIQEVMTILAKKLSEQYVLRSGGAQGADTAFAKGAGIKAEIFTADDAHGESIEMAKAYHPAWNMCNPYVKKLMGRNSMIILGR